MTKCLNCNNNKSSVVGFVVRGVFCDRTTVRGTPPSINDKYPWFVAKNIGRKICLCKDCGLLLSRDVNSNIVGFLTEREYKCYQEDAGRCDRLHKNGYFILQERHWKHKWKLGNLGLNELKECFNQRRADVRHLKGHQTTIAGTNESSIGTRRWASWEGDANFLEDAFNVCEGTNHPSLGGVRSTESTLPLVDNSIIHADIHYARRARNNHLKHEPSETTLKHEDTIELLGLACLWRRPNIDEGQCPHADTDAGHYHIVMPMSSEPYELEVFPYTHLTTSRCNKEDNIVIRSEKVTLHLRKGQILIFCSNLAHCGGRSRYPSKNMETIKQTIKLKWFTGKNEDQPVADLSIHAGLQSTLSKQNIASNYTANATEFIRVIILEEIELKGNAKQKGEYAKMYEHVINERNKAKKYLIKMKTEGFNANVDMSGGSATKSFCVCLRDSKKRKINNWETTNHTSSSNINNNDGPTITCQPTKRTKQKLDTKSSISTTEEKKEEEELVNNCRLLFHFLDDATKAIEELKESKK